MTFAPRKVPDIAAMQLYNLGNLGRRLALTENQAGTLQWEVFGKSKRKSRPS